MRATITSIICAGWKELGKKKVHCINAWDYPNWQENINDDSEVCKAIYDVLKDADAVVTHNGVRFDWKHLQTRLMMNGLPVLPKIAHIDTCLIARKNLLSFNNRLGYLGDWLVGDKKLENGGWQLWVKVTKRVKSACTLMSKYCKQDVALLEKVFEQLRPFIKNLPNRNLSRSAKKIVNGEYVCPTCGSPDLMRNGWRYTQMHKYQRVVCRHCGSCSRLDLKDRNPRAT
jgi:DNA-directed RNA polymerase subunit RPC12/RpoP